MSTEILLRYSAVDGYSKRKRFTTLAGAQRFAQGALGEHPSMGTTYAVSDDGIGKIEVIAGTTLQDLFPGAC